MLDLRFIREHADLVREGAVKKHIACDVDGLLAVDAEVRALAHRGDELRNLQKTRGKEIAKLPPEQRSEAGAELARAKEELKEVDEKLKELRPRLEAMHLGVPNVPLPEVPEGKSDEENVELRREGEVPEFDFEPVDHVELGKRLGLIDIERGVKVAGTRNYYLTGNGARLERAVMNLALDMMVERGFEMMSVPVLVRYPAMEGTAYFPAARIRRTTSRRTSSSSPAPPRCRSPRSIPTRS